MEMPRDRDFVETVEGLIFCVVGYLHPPDQVTAYLKYVPDAGGKWRKGETAYSRVIPYYHVSQVENTYGFLKENHPKYLFSCPVRNITVSSVPRDRIEVYYRPRDRLAGIMEDPQDKLEYKLRDLVTILSGLAGLDVRDIGVTGSILTSSHSPEFSDIDLTVYGQRASMVLREVLRETRRNDGLIQPFNASKRELWSLNREGRFPLGFAELMEFADRRWNYGEYMDTYFSVHPVRTDSEITEEYGDNRYYSMGSVRGSATVASDSEAIYLPAIYGLENVETDSEHEVCEVASFEGLYADMFYAGERIEFSGILERVEGKRNIHRAVMGGAGSEPSYIKRFTRAQT
jgi:predicted nucleotidyltransferase